MAYSDDQWTEVRILFESGVSLGKIIARDGIKIRSKGAISKRANAEGWKVNDRKSFISQESLTRQALNDIVVQKQTLSPLERNVHDSLVSENLKLHTFFRGANVLVANTVAAKVREQGKNASFLELSQAAAALGRTQESVLGKGPDTVINNSNAVQTVVSLSPEVLRRINQELEDEC